MILTGYKLKNGIIIVNKSLLEEIKTIFDLKEQGYSNKEIIKNCNNFKILKDLTDNYKLTKIKNMLKEKRYMGNEIYPKIIDEETFYKVQKVIDEEKNIKEHKMKVSSKKSVDTKEHTIFSKNIKCGKCNKNLGLVVMNKESKKWYCSNKVRDGINITQDNLEQKILHMLKLLKDDKLKIYEVKEGKIRKGLETFESVQIRKEFLEEIEENKYMELERYLAFQKNIVREKYKMINLISYEEKTEKIKSFIKNLKEPLYENINENLFENLLNRINIYKKSIEFEFINEEKYKMKL